MLDIFRYTIDLIRYPRRADFLDMGYGIAARYKRCKKVWSPHIEICKALQRAAVSELDNPRKISILGAGRMYDIDKKYLAESVSEVKLFDADPSVLSSWRKFQDCYPSLIVSQNITDLTSAIDQWSFALEEILRSNRDDKKETLEQYLRELKVNRSDDLGIGADIVISQNLLGQIPIYWRDRVHLLVKKHWGIDTDDDGNYPTKLQLALEWSMGLLQQDHLKLLSESNAKIILLITDRSFLYYTGTNSNWLQSEALFCDRSLSIDEYNLISSDSWFWHIAPEDIEQTGYGVIHDVYGGIYRNCSKSKGEALK